LRILIKAFRVPEYGSSDVLDVFEVEHRDPRPNQVIIEAEAIGVNFADIMQRRGTYSEGPEPPYRPGFEAAGPIFDTGEHASWDVGERVTVNVDPREESGRAYAEYVTAPRRRTIPVPDVMPLEDAAAWSIQFTTAHNAVHEWGELEEGERILIHAAVGGVGSAAVQLAREAGAEIIATASTREKLETVSEFGADHCINYTETDFTVG